MRSVRKGRRGFGAAWVAVALAVLFAVQAWAPSAEAQAKSGVAPPPGDCWGGALSEDPLHCYMFEEAQRAGLIEVAAIYLAPGKGPLWIYLEQTEPVSADVGAYFRKKAHQYMSSPQGRNTVWRDQYFTEWCDDEGDKRPRCLDYLLRYPIWGTFDSKYSNALPDSFVYTIISIDVGGAEARRSRPGWASWRQLWPAVPGAGGQAASASGSAAFDVSDVDVTNIPEPDCDNYGVFDSLTAPSCRVWSRTTDTGFAGIYTDRRNGGKDILYVQTTTPIPEEETELEALARRVLPGYKEAYEKYGWAYEVEFVPVKYNFGQLWRWSVILNRFALSAANTIGIEEASVAVNVYGRPPEPRVVYLNGVTPVANDSLDIFEDYRTRRNILRVDALESAVLIEALPRLLPALGIPTDAVGVVIQTDHGPTRIRALPGEQPASPSPSAQGAKTTERAPPPELDCDDDSGAPLLSFCDAW